MSDQFICKIWTIILIIFIKNHSILLSVFEFVFKNVSSNLGMPFYFSDISTMGEKVIKIFLIMQTGWQLSIIIFHHPSSDNF